MMIRLNLALAILVIAASGCSSKTVGFSDSGPGICQGTDNDNDGHGTGCAQGSDCDDNDPTVYPGAVEICDNKDNDCDGQVDEDNVCGGGGTCDPKNCRQIGNGTPFPLDPSSDPGLINASGVSTDPNGDLVIGKTSTSFNYMWIANTFDMAGHAGGCRYAHQDDYDAKLDAVCRGSVSKVDTRAMKEVARYFTVTCFSRPGSTGCVDTNGKPIVKQYPHAPSRTAVDFNFDVWVANRAFGGQASVTKIASNKADCVDRNNNGKIDTSADRDGDGKINVDCDADGLPDSSGTVCKGSLAGKQPEFLGDDDECILFTVNFADKNDVGRSVCLAQDIEVVGASDAWVGTFQRDNTGNGKNTYYRIDGKTGAFVGTVEMPEGHHSYGCTADNHGIIWSTDSSGQLAFFQSQPPYKVGPVISSPKKAIAHQKPSTYTKGYHYGIAPDGKGRIWLGGHNACQALRYTPARAGFDTLHRGSWMTADLNCPKQTVDEYKHDHTRGIAPDTRGKVWVAVTSGTIVRVPQDLADGHHDLRQSKDVWTLEATGVVGVGVDFDGHIWGVGNGNHMASRLEVNAQGDVTSTQTKSVSVGKNPYTYSDFTGFGLANFVLPRGTYHYRLDPCPPDQRARWKKISWNADTPPLTAVYVRARSGDSDTSFGQWTTVASASPLVLESNIRPNPARMLEVEVTLESQDRLTTPVVRDLRIDFTCAPKLN
jgi:hypothetical protein